MIERVLAGATSVAEFEGRFHDYYFGQVPEEALSGAEQEFVESVCEKLDVTVVICANRLYRILMIELARTGAGAPGPAAQSMLSLGDPAIDWVKLAEAQGVPAVRCETADSFDREFARSVAQPGPKLIEAVI